MLWAFHFGPGLDADGNPKYPDPDAATSNLTRRPCQFECVLTPRSEDIAELIREESQRAEEALKDWD